MKRYATGIALVDVFELKAYAWEDDVADLPLTYVFGYVSGSADPTDTASEMVVRAAQEVSEATDVYLPQVGKGNTRADGHADLVQDEGTSVDAIVVDIELVFYARAVARQTSFCSLTQTMLQKRLAAIVAIFSRPRNGLPDPAT